MKLFITCYEGSDSYVILSATIKEPKTLNKDFAVFEISDTKLFSFIADKLLNNIPLSFAKNIQDLTLDTLVIGDVENINTIRQRHIYKCYEKFSNHVMAIPNIAFFEFQLISTELASRGYFITKQNREEKYLEILEKGIEEEIALLEKYLTLLDDLSKYRTLYYELLQVLDKINSSENKDEIASLSENYKV